jgi:hypothetical protein
VGIEPKYQKEQIISLLFGKKKIYKQMNLPKKQKTKKNLIQVVYFTGGTLSQMS